MVGNPPTTTDERYVLEVVSEPLTHHRRPQQRARPALGRRTRATPARRWRVPRRRLGRVSAISGTRNHRGLLRQAVVARAANGHDRVPRGAPDEHVRLLTEGRRVLSTAMARGRTPRRSWRRCLSSSKRPRSHGVDVSYGLSPGLSIRYSDRDRGGPIAWLSSAKSANWECATSSCSSTTFRCSCSTRTTAHEFRRPGDGSGRTHRPGTPTASTAWTRTSGWPSARRSTTAAVTSRTWRRWVPNRSSRSTCSGPDGLSAPPNST